MGRVAAYTQSHIICLIGAIVSSVVLAVTVNCVWYPYLQTASFYPSVCTAGNILTVYSATACPSAQCPAGAPPSPATPYHTIHLNTSRTPPSFISSTSTTSDINIQETTATTTALTNESTSLPTTTSFTSVTSGPSSSATIPSWVTAPGCIWFPCVKMSVNYKATGQIAIVLGSGQLYPNYQQLQNYPSCSYSSCQSNNKDNVDAVNEWVKSIVSLGQFQCYVNEYNFHQILQQVNFSYAAAINSILWPIISLTIFGSMFIALRIASYCPKNRARNRPTTAVDDANAATPYSVNYTATGNAMAAPGGFPVGLPLPPAYHDVAGVTTYSNGVAFPTLDEKDPAAFADVRGNADGNGSMSGAAATGLWVEMHPPNYTEPVSVAADRKLPGTAATGGPYEDGAVAFSYPMPRSFAPPGTVSGPVRVNPSVAAETDLGVAGTAARY